MSGGVNFVSLGATATKPKPQATPLNYRQEARSRCTATRSRAPSPSRLEASSSHAQARNAVSFVDQQHRASAAMTRRLRDPRAPRLPGGCRFRSRDAPRVTPKPTKSARRRRSNGRVLHTIRTRGRCAESAVQNTTIKATSCSPRSARRPPSPAFTELATPACSTSLRNWSHQPQFRRHPAGELQSPAQGNPSTGNEASLQAPGTRVSRPSDSIGRPGR